VPASGVSYGDSYDGNARETLLSERETSEFRATVGELEHQGATPQAALASLQPLLPAGPIEPIVIWPPAAVSRRRGSAWEPA
jgi:hypothetical protein